MKPIPITSLTLDLPLHPAEIKNFRGAVVEMVLKHKKVFDSADIPTDLFHNHDESVWNNDEKKQTKEDYLIRYPLIQYRVHQKKAEIIGIGQAATAPELWLLLGGDEITFSKNTYPLKVDTIAKQKWSPSLNGRLGAYRISNWLPLNGKNYERWQNTSRLADKVGLLDKALWGHLLSFAEHFSIEIDKGKLELFVSSIDMQTFKTAYKVNLLAMDITFCTNLNLPDEIGLGQKVSLGFGKVQQIKKK